MEQQQTLTPVQKIIQHIELITEKCGYNPVIISDIYFRCILETQREKLILKKVFIEGMLEYMEKEHLFFSHDTDVESLFNDLAEKFINENFEIIKPIL